LVRVKCKKCAAVFEQGFGGAVLAPHLGPYHYVQCPCCKKNSWLNTYSSTKEPITWPPQEKQVDQIAEPQLTEEELEKKRIEDSKYERV
jgi:hypothetical protein